MSVEPILHVPGMWRFEYKYILPVQKIFQIQNSLKPFVKPDFYTKSAAGGKYLVRSLYFDSYDYRFFHEKVDGDYDRIKLRIRSYSPELEPDTTLRAEIKVRKGSIMEKHSVFISAQEYSFFIENRKWQNAINPVLVEFERYCWLKTLEPQLLVQYQREGFVARFDEGVRITFDYRVTSASAKSLFPNTPILREHHRNIVILEIKCRKNQPYWLLDLVRRHGLRVMACSKYCKGIETSKANLVTPSWSY